MADKALTVHLRNCPPLMICPHYRSEHTQVRGRIISHLLFPFVAQEEEVSERLYIQTQQHKQSERLLMQKSGLNFLYFLASNL